MSQFANTVLAERPFPVPSAYYPRNSPRGPAASGATPMPLPSHQEPPHQAHAMWPHYYVDPTSLPAQSAVAFSSYVAPAAPSVSPSPSAWAPSWQSTTIPTALTSVGPERHISDFQQCLVRQAATDGYQTSSESLPQPSYPAQTQRTVLPPSPSQLSPSLSSLYRFRSDQKRSPASHGSTSEYAGWNSPRSTTGESEYRQSAMGVTAATDDETTSYIDDSRDRDESSPVRSSSSSQTPVKLEPDDPEGCFIMELSAFPPDTPSSHAMGRSALHAYTTSLLSQSLAPPTEVPLRATQASKEMRKLMSAFRVNPFAMHSLSVNDGGKEGLEWLEGDHGQATWCGGEARPLEEEPLMFEFQLDLNWTVDQDADSQGSSEFPVRNREDGGDYSYSGGSGLETKDESELRSFSPSFELHSDDVDPEIRQEANFQATSQNQDDENDYDEAQGDVDQDQDQQSESWGGVDGSNHSEASTNGSTNTRLGNTPFSESPDVLAAQVQSTYGYHEESSPPSIAGWSAVNEQCHSNEEYSGVLSSSSVSSRMGMAPPGHGGIKAPRLHTTTSHPYLRKGVHSYQVAPSHTHVSSHAHRTSHAQPPGLELLNQAAHHSYHHSHHSLHYHQPQPTSQHDDETSFSQSQQHQSQQQTLGIYHHGLSMSDAVRESVQRVGVPMVPSYMRVIRSSRHSEIDYEQGVGACTPRSTSSASNEVGGYASSSETSTGGLPSGTIPPQLHSVQTNASVDGLAMNRRWSLPETGVGQGIARHFLTGM